MISIIPGWVLWAVAGLIGAIFGSFANVCIVRLPRGESVVFPRSHCVACGRVLSWWENIPILSYLFLRGRCRGCRARISPRYPLVEAVSTGLALLAWWYFRHPLPFFVYTGLFLIPLVVVTFIDLEHQIIPDEISLPGIAVGLTVAIWFSATGDRGATAAVAAAGAVVGAALFFFGERLYRRMRHGESSFTVEFTVAGALVGVIGAALIAKHFGVQTDAALDGALGSLVGGVSLVLVALAYEKIRKQDGLGGGDVKLIAMLGAFFGWRAAIFILFLSSVLGSLVGVVAILALRKDLKYAIPFGPFLALAGVIQLFFGSRLIGWYLDLLR